MKIKKPNTKITNYLFNLKKNKTTKTLFANNNSLYLFIKYSNLSIKNSNFFSKFKALNKKYNYTHKKKITKKKKITFNFF